MSDSTQDLRTRRRLATEQDIHHAALTLMKQQGFAATTVDEIVAAAGVSQRTFFRYFATKEDAVLMGYRVIDDAIDSLELPGEPRAALEALLTFHGEQIDQITDDGADRYVTLQRLISTEAPLRDAVAARELASMERLRIRLEAHLPGHQPLASRLIAEIATAILRATFDHWRAQQDCSVSDLPGMYREVLAAAETLAKPR